jgi:AbiV family abortive infection protein
MAANKPDSEQRNELLNRLALGTEKTLDNAVSLFNEASSLRKGGFLCRALFLHQISLEECAKIETLGAAATSLLMGHEVDFVKIRNALISHARKNRTNAYFLEVSPEEKAAIDAGDLEGALKVFSAMKDRFHLKSNTAKNASLYVDFDDKLNFIAPKDCIKDEMVAEIAALNEQYLDLSVPKVKMLRKWVALPGDAEKLVTQFEKLLEQHTTENPDDPRKIMAQTMKEMLQIMRDSAKPRQES